MVTNCMGAGGVGGSEGSQGGPAARQGRGHPIGSDHRYRL